MGVLAWNAGWTFAGAGLGMANAVRHRVRGYRTPRPFGADDVERNVDYVLGVSRLGERQGWTRPGGASSRSGRAPTSEQVALLALGVSTYVAYRFPLAVAAFRAAPGHGSMSTSRSSPPGPPRAWVRSPTSTFDRPSMRPCRTPRSSTSGHAGELQVDACRRRDRRDPRPRLDPQTHTRWLRERDPWNILRYPTWFLRPGDVFPGDPQSAARIGLRSDREWRRDRVYSRSSTAKGSTTPTSRGSDHTSWPRRFRGKLRPVDGPALSNVQPRRRPPCVAQRGPRPQIPRRGEFFWRTSSSRRGAAERSSSSKPGGVLEQSGHEVAYFATSIEPSPPRPTACGHSFCRHLTTRRATPSDARARSAE